LNEYYTQNDPFKKAETESITVDVQSVQPITDKTWRVEWKETHRDRNGGSTSILNYQATITIVINPPSDEKTIFVNPLGIYVNTFNWSERI
jgi:type IV secretion system protein TrbF